MQADDSPVVRQLRRTTHFGVENLFYRHSRQEKTRRVELQRVHSWKNWIALCGVHCELLAISTPAPSTQPYKADSMEF